MLCYQVTAQFVFHEEPLGSHKAGIGFCSSKKQKVKAFLILPGLPFGHGLKYSRFFRTEQEVEQYVCLLPSYGLQKSHYFQPRLSRWSSFIVSGGFKCVQLTSAPFRA
jgi:hypothetical protein